MRTWLPVLAFTLVLAVPAVLADDKSGTDADGFLQKWLVLAPIPFEADEAGADVLGKELVKDEAKLKPKAGDKVAVRKKDLVWKEHATTDHLLDFNGVLGAQTEDSVAYAVTFVTVPADVKDAKMRLGSDDQVKVWLNGKEVFKHAEARAADKDQDTVEVALQKGVNLLVVKVVNEKIDWSCCVRFVDKDDKPIAGLSCATKE